MSIKYNIVTTEYEEEIHRVFALIKNNIVENCIVCDEDLVIDNLRPGYDQIIEITNMNPYPAIGSVLNQEGIFTDPNI